MKNALKILFGFIYVDLAGDLEKIRSTFGFIFLLGKVAY
jgi:hypothetical protein